MIIVKKDYSKQDILQASLKAAEFKPAKATSGVTNVIDQACLRKTIILCDDHYKTFKSFAKRDGYYQQREYPYVMGNCDYCKVFGRSQLFIHETLLPDVWLTKDQDRKDRKNATIV